jgi:hypothetical protein
MTLTSKPKRARFAYIYYGFKPRNWRGLKDYIYKDDEGFIINRRRRDNIFNNAKNYI